MCAAVVTNQRLVRLENDGVTNRHREQALALCREVLPGPPARPKLTKLDWQSLLQTLTGVENALYLVEEVAPLSERQRKEPRAPPP